MKFDVIIQARMNSTRFPGKVLKKINGLTVLELVINRLEKSKNINNIIVATTVSDYDNEIVNLVSSLGVKVFRGDEVNVLERYYLAASRFGSQNIIRITSDCPLIDSSLVDLFINTFQKELVNNQSIDYLSNKIIPTYPIGQDIEIFSYGTLEKTYKSAKARYQLEHVTPYIYENSNEFNIYSMINEVDLSKERMTLDTKEDLDYIETIYSYFDDIYFDMKKIINLLEKNPLIRTINMHIKQKKYNE